MANAQNFKNILFDLGGVILDINVQATLRQFYEMGFPAELMQYPESMSTDVFFKYQTGKLDTVGFRNAIRKIAGVDMSDESFDKAWNAMLVRIPEERTVLLQVFKKIYYSHEIGWHKPDHEAWEHVIRDAGIRPEETLFLDDNIHNIKASQELGFQAIHIHERTNLMSLGFDL